jgi:tellurite resistance protein
MTHPIGAMATWVGALARGGLLITEEEALGAQLALDLIGEGALSELRQWFADQPAGIVDRERAGAIRACIWVAQADRELEERERELIARVIQQSELPAATQRELFARLEDLEGAPEALDDLRAALTQPGLRQLMVALGYSLAHLDGRISQLPGTSREVKAEEAEVLSLLAEAFELSEARRDALNEAAMRAAVAGR